MAIRAHSSQPTIDTRREGCDVRLQGEDWTVVEVLRSLGQLSSRITFELRDMKDGTHLLAAGSPDALVGVLMAMPIVAEDRNRVLRRLVPTSNFAESDLKQVRSSASM